MITENFGYLLRRVLGPLRSETRLGTSRMQRMYSFLCLLRYVSLEPEDEEMEEEEVWRRCLLSFLRELF